MLMIRWMMAILFLSMLLMNPAGKSEPDPEPPAMMQMSGQNELPPSRTWCCERGLTCCQ